MQWLLLAAATALVGGAVCWFIVSRSGRRKRALALVLPIAFSVLLWPLAFRLGEEVATCDAPDCGPLMFVALSLFAGVVSLSGGLGAAFGAWRALRTME